MPPIDRAPLGQKAMMARDNQYVGMPKPEPENPDWDIDGNGTPLDRIWNDWNEAGQYLAQINLEKACTIYKDYAEGNGGQERYMPDGIPHVTLPVIPSIIRQKTSTICQNPVRIEYFSNMSDKAGRILTNFSDYQLVSIKFQRLIKSCVRYALIEGLSLAHAYWDEDSIGRDAIAKGAVRLERVSVLKVRVANKDVKDIQDQEWVIIASREKVKKVRRMCRTDDARDKVQPDNADFDHTMTENGGKLCTVLTRYFRIDGEVYFEKACKGTMLCDPTPLNPNLDILTGEEAWKLMDPQHAQSPDHEPDGRETAQDRVKWNRYPIEWLVLTEMDDSYLGVSDVEDMLPGQNAINAMYSLAVQNGIDIQTKYIAKEDALGNQTITNEIGEVLIDHHRGNGDGIKVLTGVPQMTNEMLQLPLSLIETVRKLKSTSDVTMGDVSKEYSATAISLLQTAAEKPTEDMTAQKEEFAERIGRVLLQFYRFYYEDTRYMFDISNAERKELSDRLGVPMSNVPSRVEGRFNGTDFMEDAFDIKVSAGPGGKLSQSTEYSFLIQFFQLAPNLTPTQKRMFVEKVPSHILNDKQKLLELIDEEESGQVAQLEATVKQQQAVIKSLQGGSKEMGTIINYLTNYIREYEKQAGSLLKSKDEQIGGLLDGRAAEGLERQANAENQNKGNNVQKTVS